jgi:hypothetical protein
MKLYTRNGIMFVGLLAVAAIGITWLARAAFTTPLNAFAVWPRKTISDPNVGNLTIRGKAEEQVFRTGGPLGSGTFANLDPKNGVCPPGQVLTFLKGNSGAIGANDFVYALKVHNTAVAPAVLLADGPVNITQLSSSYCLAGAGLIPTSSIGYCSTAGQIPGTPTSFNESPGGLDFFWGNTGPGQDHSILPGQQSVVLFYTSPIPPARASATISGFGVTQQAVQGSGPPPSDDPDPPGNMNNFPIYGPCRTEITIHKQVACSASGFQDPNGINNETTQALDGGDVYYRIIVYNSGGVRLDNIMISDPKLKAGGNLTSDFTGAKIFRGNPALGVNLLTDTGKTFSGALLTNESISKVFGPFKATTGAGVAGTSVVSGVNTASTNADYIIPNPDGTQSSQSVQLTKSDTASLTVLAPAIACQKLVNGASSLTIPDNASYPFVLTYSLKGTNTGTTNLDITLNDPKLQALIAAPPPGVTFGGDTLPKVCSGVAPNGMCQATVTLTLASAGAFPGISDNPALSPFTSTNLMTAGGVVSGFTGCTVGANNAVTSAPCQTVVNQIPSCSISLTKAVACSTPQGPGTFMPQAVALRNGAIVYRYVVTNTGQDTLANVVITDDKLTSPQFNVGTLNPGQSRTIDVPSTAPAVAGQLINKATASADCVFAQKRITSTEVTAMVDVIDPQISCDKRINGVTNLTGYKLGDPLTYTLRVINPLESGTLLDITISDNKIPAGFVCRRSDTNAVVTLPFTFTDVPAGESRTITCTGSFNDVGSFLAASGGAMTLTNTMMASAVLPPTMDICLTGANPAPPFTCSSQASLTPDVLCSISLTKAVACGTAQAPGTFGPTLTALKGSTVVYRYVVTNTGQDILNNVVITDDKITDPQFTVGTLNPGQSRTILVQQTEPNAGAITNKAKASADCVFAKTSINSAEVTATVNVIEPTITCEKKVNGATSIPDYTFGAPVTYTITVTNSATSGTPLDIKVEDAKLASLTGFTIKRTDTDTVITLPFTFTNVPPGESRTISATGSFADTSAFVQQPDKTFLLTNTMTATPTLPVGSQICTTGAPPLLPCASFATVIIGPPCSISLTKAIACGTAQAPGAFGPTATSLRGSSVVYRYVVTNTGDDTLNNVLIMDDKITDPQFNVGTLAPGQARTIFVQQAAGAVGTLINKATAKGNCAFNNKLTASQEVTAALTVIDPVITCDKQVNGQKEITNYQFGAPLTYTLTVTNSAASGTPLDIRVDDDRIGKNPGLTGFTCLVNGNPVTLPFTFTNVPPGESRTITCTGTIANVTDFLVASGNATTLTNTMTASATLPNGSTICVTGASPAPPFTCSSQAKVTPNVPCTITLTKAVACGTSPVAGDFGPTVTSLRNSALVYRYVVANTGLDVINNVVITDDKITDPQFTVGTLNPGQSKTIDVPATAPNTVGPLVNNATASGDCLFNRSKSTSQQVTATVNVIDPQIACDKKVNGVTNLSNYQLGDLLTYTLTVTNSASSGTPLDITVADDKIPGLAGFTCKVGANTVTLPFKFTNVPAGESRTITCTGSFADVASFLAATGGGTTLTNKMTATAELPPGTQICLTGANPAPPYRCESVATVTPGIPCNIDLTKAVACGTVQTPGTFGPTLVTLKTSSIVYRYVVTNTGQDILNNVVITDDKITDPQFTVGTLNPGQSKTILVQTTAPNAAGPLVNKATASGDCVFNKSKTTSPERTATVNVIDPVITCDKKVNGAASIPDYTFGAPVTYTITVTNSATSGTPLDIKVEDAKLASLTGFTIKRTDTDTVVTLPFTFANVPPGESRTISATGSFPDTSAFVQQPDKTFLLTNTMTATPTLPVGSPVCATGAPALQACTSAANVIVGPPCSVSLTKAIACGTVQAPGTFGPTATSLRGSSVVYRYVVTNTGQDTLNNVLIMDDKLTDPQFNVGTLAPGQARTIFVQQAAGAVGTLINKATARGNCAFNNKLVASGEVTAALTVIDPQIACEKKVNNVTNLTGYKLGDPLTYTLRVTNSASSGTPLDITIADDKIPGLVGFTCRRSDTNAVVTLPFKFTGVAPGESRTITCTGTIANVTDFLAASGNAMTLTNRMTALAELPQGTQICLTGANPAPPFRCESVATVTPDVPCAINLTKTVACGTSPVDADFGPTATALKNAAVVYRYVVSNTGQDVLNNVVITDDKLTNAQFNVGTLNPGQSRTINVASTSPNTVGPLTNKATASGDCLFGKSKATSPERTATINVIDPQIACDKKVNGVATLNNYKLGDAVTYTLTVTNSASSGTPLDITVADDKIPGLAGFTCRRSDTNAVVTLPFTFTNVPAGESRTITCTGSFASTSGFTQQPDGSFKLTNNLTASGNLPAGSRICRTGASPAPPYTCSSQANVIVAPNCAISLTKEVACGTTQAPGSFGPLATAVKGTPVVYRYVIRNDGETILDNVTITDDKVTDPQFNVGSLNPGQSRTILVQQTFNAAGAVTNRATVRGTCRFNGQQATSQVGSATVNVLDLRIDASKTVNGVGQLSDYEPGDPLTFTLTFTNPAANSTPLDVVVSDDRIPGLAGFTCKVGANTVTLPFTFPNVPAGESRTITCTGTFSDREAFFLATGGGDTLINNMTVVGTLPAGSPICNTSPPIRVTGAGQARVTIGGFKPPTCVLPPVCQGPDCVGTINDPGALPPDGAAVSDQIAGSILFYNFYSSNAINPTLENTRINLTNTARESVFIHFFFVEGSTCSVADSFVCLSQNQTIGLLASDIDPGIRGYLVAVAVDVNGCPIKWNHLIGDEYIKLSSGHAANLGAEAFRAIAADPTGCTAASPTASILLDGVHYTRAPRTLAVDSIASNQDGNSTQLIINRVGGDLSSRGATVGALFGLLYDDLEKPYSFSFSSNECQTVRTLSNVFPRTTPRLDTIIPSGRSGWMRLSSSDGNALLGAVLTFNPSAGSSSSAYSQGRNMHKLTLADSVEYIIPIFPPKG